MGQVRLKSILNEPKKIVKYYKYALKRPKDLAMAIDYGEDLKDTSLALLVATAILLLASALTSAVALHSFGSLTGLVSGFIAMFIGMFIGGGVIYLISIFSGGKANFNQSMNICIHGFILTLPLSIMQSFLSVIALVVMVIQFIFLSYVLVHKFEASKNKVYIACGALAFFIVVPMMCSMMAMSFIGGATGLTGALGKQAGVAGYLSGMQKVGALRPDCMNDHEDSNNIHWKTISLSSFTGLILAVKSGQLEEVAEGLVSGIDTALDDDHGMDGDQVSCLRKFQKSLRKELL